MTHAFILAVAALLTSLYGPAQAAPQTYSRAVTTDRNTQVLHESFDMQPSAPSSATASVGAITSSASADFGVIKLFADAPLTPGHAGLSQAFGSFTDTLTFSGTDSEPLAYSIGFVATGVVVNHAPGTGDWAYLAMMRLRGEFVDDSANVTMITSDTGTVSIAASLNGVMVPNKPVELFVYFTIETSGLESSAFQLDFSHTALLTGITVPAGTSITSQTLGVLPSGGGSINYPAALRELAPVPEPSAAALFACGLALLVAVGLARRRA